MDSEYPANTSSTKNPKDYDTITESRPPIPRAVADRQPAPEDFGQESYTTRQPWMMQDHPVVDEQGSNSGFVLEGVSLTDGKENGVDSPSGRSEETELPSEEESGMETPYVPEPMIRRRSRGNGVLISLFFLFAKAVPLFLVIGGGYYTYSYYFGPVPIVDDIWRKSAAMAGVEVAPPVERSKASKILDQTRGVVNANDQRVNFASALADQDVDINTLSTPEDMSPSVAEVADESTFSSSGHSIPQQNDGPSLAMKMAGNLAETLKSKLTLGDQDVAEEVVEEVKASSEFITWVMRARISGVRRGANPRIYINDLAVHPGDIIYHPLKIKILEVDADDTYLTFQDKTGATYRRRY